MGAKLLQLLHTASDDRGNWCAREAIRDLRELLQSMDGHEVRLDVAAARWQEENGQPLPGQRRYLALATEIGRAVAECRAVQSFDPSVARSGQ
ncbi:hypothetical protein ULF88_02715 [Halopseudomonas pachastrellae]|nr:hypothetical protein [Halopseudomonas pachastrellae]